MLTIRVTCRIMNNLNGNENILQETRMLTFLKKKTKFKTNNICLGFLLTTKNYLLQSLNAS